MQLPRLTIRRRDRKFTREHGELLNCRRRVVKTVLQVICTPAGLESCDERPQDLLISADRDRGCRRREIFLGEVDCDVCEVRLVIRSAVQANISEPRSTIICLDN